MGSVNRIGTFLVITIIMDDAPVWVFTFANCPGRDAVKLPAAEKPYHISSRLTWSPDHFSCNDLLLHFIPKFTPAFCI